MSVVFPALAVPESNETRFKTLIILDWFFWTVLTYRFFHSIKNYVNNCIPEFINGISLTSFNSRLQAVSIPYCLLIFKIRLTEAKNFYAILIRI